MEGYSPQRHRATKETLTPPLTLSQRYHIGESTQFGSPISVLQNFLLIEGEHKLHALASDSGDTLWQFNLPGTYVSPAVSDGNVFVRAESGETGYLFAITLDSGLKLWQFQFPSVGSPYNNVGGHVTSPVVIDDLVLIGASQTLRALEAETGQEIWAFETKEPIVSSASVASERVYFSDFTRLYALNLKTGEEVWHFDYDEMTLFFAPILRADKVIITSLNTIFVLNRHTGDIGWTKNLPAETLVPAGADEGQVYVKAVNQLYALAMMTGDTVWQYQVPDFISLPAITNQHLYIITRAGGTSQLRAVTMAQGQEIWLADRPAFANAAPVVAGGRLYVRTVDGQVLAYE